MLGRRADGASDGRPNSRLFGVGWLDDSAGDRSLSSHLVDLARAGTPAGTWLAVTSSTPSMIQQTKIKASRKAGNLSPRCVDLTGMP